MSNFINELIEQKLYVRLQEIVNYLYTFYTSIYDVSNDAIRRTKKRIGRCVVVFYFKNRDHIRTV